MAADNLESKSRAQLQAMCKERGIRANAKTVDMIKWLRESLEKENGSDTSADERNTEHDSTEEKRKESTQKLQNNKAQHGRDSNRKNQEAESSMPKSKKAVLFCVVHRKYYEVDATRSKWGTIELIGGIPSVNGKKFVLIPCGHKPTKEGVPDNMICPTCVVRNKKGIINAQVTVNTKNVTSSEVIKQECKQEDKKEEVQEEKVEEMKSTMSATTSKTSNKKAAAKEDIGTKIPKLKLAPPISIPTTNDIARTDRDREPRIRMPHKTSTQKINHTKLSVKRVPLATKQTTFSKNPAPNSEPKEVVKTGSLKILNTKKAKEGKEKNKSVKAKQHSGDTNHTTPLKKQNVRQERKSTIKKSAKKRTSSTFEREDFNPFVPSKKLARSPQQNVENIYG
eukprot:m.4302 g.4302  ORF g.4302 m.4302 type:complete len:395 (-) comp2951_c0_seq1:119-1303(-)